MPEYHIICGGLDAPSHIGEKLVELDVQGEGKNVELKIEAISKALMGNIPDVLLDLLEIGAYVFCADGQIRRGGLKLQNYGERWYREMHFRIPVREVDLWNSEEMQEALTSTLSFLAGEHYAFEFVRAERPRIQHQLYFEFEDINMQPDEVALFSGGLDSFAGAVEALAGQGKKMALVGHHSANQIKGIQARLAEALEGRGLAGNLNYVSVTARNAGDEPPEYTQRTRSFLFACLAAAVAHMLGKNRFTFYENGVISLNIPISSDVIGSRATRTTHPRAIQGFKRIFSLALDTDFNVDHPYQWLTKREVTEKIAKYGFEDLIPETNSCTRLNRKSKKHPHCGVCSQCIDRRFAILAAGLEEHDESDQYKVDLLTGDRSRDQQVVMAVNYVKFAREFQKLRLEDMLSEHPTVAEALGDFEDLSSGEAERKIYDLYWRHTADVMKVIKDGFDRHKDELLVGRLVPNCLLSLYFHRGPAQEPVVSNYDEECASFTARIDRFEAPKCEFCVDTETSRILFRGDFFLEQSDYALFHYLLSNFREGKWKGIEIAFIRAPDLADGLGIEEASLRQLINRLRTKVAQRLGEDLGIVFGSDDLIENRQGQGYRLSRSLKEVGSPDDLKA